jgi:hypothetical protein
MSVLVWDMGIFFEQIGSFKEKYIGKRDRNLLEKMLNSSLASP